MFMLCVKTLAWLNERKIFGEKIRNLIYISNATKKIIKGENSHETKI